MISKLSYILSLAMVIFCSAANAKQTECGYVFTNSSEPTSELVGPNFGTSRTFKVHATAMALYYHKDGSSIPEIVNLDQGAAVVVDAKEEGDPHELARKKAKALLHQKALTRRIQLCVDHGCKKQQ